MVWQVLTQRVRYYSTHQDDMRADLYQTALDGAAAGNEDIGRRVVLPATFVGKLRHNNINVREHVWRRSVRC